MLGKLFKNLPLKKYASQPHLTLTISLKGLKGLKFATQQFFIKEIPNYIKL
jgi:hypothetical protein